MVNHFVAASFLRLYFIIFSSAVSLLRKMALHGNLGDE